MVLAHCALSQTYNALFIGHSQTNFTMPRYIASLAKQAGYTYTYKCQIINGSTLKYQWENSANAQGADGKEELPTGKYDVVFLNDNRPFVSASSEANSIFYGNKWWDLALNNSSVRVFLQPYWPWKTDDPYYNPDPSYEKVIADRRVIYERIAVGMEKAHPGKKIYISPIDMAVVKLVRKIEKGEVPGFTTIADIYGDEVHLTDVGKYLNACVNYAVIYRKSPVGLPGKMYNEWGKLMIEIPETAAKIFQEVAWQSCMEYPRSGISLAVTGNETKEAEYNYSIFPNPVAGNDIMIESSENLSNAQISLHDQLGVSLPIQSEINDRHAKVVMEGLKEGLYILRIKNKDQVRNEKIYINRH